MMKTWLYLVPAALCVALTFPAQGHGSAMRTAQQPDTAVVIDDSDMEALADTVVDGDDDWAEADTVEAPAEVCPTDDELLSEFETKEADYNLQDKRDANCGVSFAATVYVPEGGKQRTGFINLASNVLSALLPEETATSWKPDNNIEKMFENKWKAVKALYLEDTKDAGATTYYYRTNIMPAWRWKTAGGLTTYKVDDEFYTGGAHGMAYGYYLTLGEQKDGLLGLTDIFKEESLPAVFKLVGQKLASRPNAPQQEDIWKPVAELSADPTPDTSLLRAQAVEQYEGKWYPRPALTQCGVVFSYQPYEKDCYAAGIIDILLPYDEVADYLNMKP